MNTVNGSVTIYHYDAENGKYTPAQYPNASIYHGTRTAPQNGGFISAGYCKIRIPTCEIIDISTDDYVFLGLTDEPIDKGLCLKVTSFGDNRRGSKRMHHWRIECDE